MERSSAQWKAKKLSYAGHMQLLSWVFGGKVNYWVQSTRLPKKTLKKIRLTGYNFLWDGRMGASWDMITLSKEEGSLIGGKGLSQN